MAKVSATTLIQRALVLAGLSNPEEEIDAGYLSSGKVLLDEVLTLLSQLGCTIPYRSTLTLPLVPGCYQYTIGWDEEADVQNNPISQIVAAHLDVADKTHYPLWPMTLAQDNAWNYQQQQGLPRYYFRQPGNDRTVLRFFPTPDEACHVTLSVKQTLQSIRLFDMAYALPSFFISVVIYELASWLSDYWGLTLPTTVEARRQELSTLLKTVSAEPLQTIASDTLTPSQGAWG